MNAPSPARPRAFSLVEMMVALVIVAVLAALLFPAVQAAIERGRNGACIGRLRAIGAALLQYTADNDGNLIPYASMDGATRFWFDELNPYMGIPETDTNRTQPYDWQLCPSKPFNKYPEDKSRRQAVGYGWNYRQFGNNKSDEASGSGKGNRRLSEVTLPARTIIIADSIDVPDASGAIPPISQNRLLYNWRVDFLASRHSGQGNYLMLDGHVVPFKPEDVVAQTGSGLLPNTPWWGIKQKY